MKHSTRRIHAVPPAPTIFARQESRVRSYSRVFPALFARAEGAFLFDTDGNAYLDGLAGAGSLNYGHNHPALADALVDYIRTSGITHSLDLHTAAKAEFLSRLESQILRPRGLDYVVQFPGPTGANAVEAAFKLARKFTGRSDIVAFTNGFHGVTLGALAATGNAHHRGGAGLPLAGVTRMPYDGYLGDGVDTLAYFERVLADASSGITAPAAVIVETVQGEGGVNTASATWLSGLQALCRRHDILLIVDDIQAGCGRTGGFFSFETAGLVPDIVTLSKSLSGFGLPLAVTLLRRDLDIWKPGEHNGTFRGNNHAFVTAAKALELFWSNDTLAIEVQHKAAVISARLQRIVQAYAGDFIARGRGMLCGLACRTASDAAAISREAFRRRLIVETCGPRDDVVKLLFPLTMATADLVHALDLLDESIAAVVANRLH